MRRVGRRTQRRIWLLLRMRKMVTKYVPSVSSDPFQGALIRLLPAGFVPLEEGLTTPSGRVRYCLSGDELSEFPESFPITTLACER